jgi:hypothetical protein
MRGVSNGRQYLGARWNACRRRFLHAIRRTDNLRVEQIGKINFAFCTSHDAVTRIYYLYWVNLRKDAFRSVKLPLNIICGPYRHNFRNSQRTIRINHQIEHTLTRKGGRNLRGARPGVISVPDQGEETYLVRIQDYPALIKSEVIIDYSIPNLINIQGSRRYQVYTKKALHIAPLLYEPESLDCNQQRDLNVVTVFGNPNEPYRRRFLETLKRSEIDATNVMGSFDDVEWIYRKPAF